MYPHHFWFLHQSRVYSETVSQPVLSTSVWPFLTLQGEESSRQVFRSFFRGDSFIYSCRITAFMKGGELRIFLCHHIEPRSLKLGFPDSSVGKESTCNAGDPSSIPGSARSAGEAIKLPTPVFLGFPCGSAGKESNCNAGDLGSISGLGKSPGEGKGYPLQHFGLENSMDCIVPGVAMSQT